MTWTWRLLVDHHVEPKVTKETFAVNVKYLNFQFSMSRLGRKFLRHGICAREKCVMWWYFQSFTIEGRKLWYGYRFHINARVIDEKGKRQRVLKSHEGKFLCSNKALKTSYFSLSASSRQLRSNVSQHSLNKIIMSWTWQCFVPRKKSLKFSHITHFNHSGKCWLRYIFFAQCRYNVSITTPCGFLLLSTVTIVVW